MVLEEKADFVHNRIRSLPSSMEGTTVKIPHPPSTNYHNENGAGDENGFFSPPAKKRRTGDKIVTSSPTPSSPRNHNRSNAKAAADIRSPRRSKKHTSRTEVPDSENEDGDMSEDEQRGCLVPTQLESALPPMQTDEEAIEAYEAYKAAESVDVQPDTLHSRLENKSWTRGRSSIYVDAFNLALDTVLEEEGHLFDDAEMTVFKCWRSLDYEAQYLYVRLFLRKTSSWFRIGRLGYYSDISDLPGAVGELQKERELPKVEADSQMFPGESVLPEEAVPLGVNFMFAECSEDHINSLDEASSLLLLDELKAIAKDAKVQGKNKSELLKNLRRTSGKQKGLGFLKRSETEESIDSEKQSVYDSEDDSQGGSRTPNKHMNRDAHFTRKILDQTGKCIRLSLTPLKLFERVHLVFYRSTEWTEKSLTTLILAKISRRNFPEYIASRSTNIFESRSLLLEFEASLRTQFRVDNILEFERLSLEELQDILEAVYPRWKVLVQKEQQKEDSIYETGEGAYLRRFSPAWVYTRIVHKGLHSLARFKEHLREHGILTELLDQRLFHAARRGAWYQRKALLEEHYMAGLVDAHGRTDEANKKHWKRIALQTCEAGLQDRDCHIIYHYDLQKRVMKLEKQLRVPKREQHEFSHVGLGKARERGVEGIQIIREDTPARSLRRKDSNGKSRSRSRERPESASKEAVVSASPRRSTKTIWLDTLDTNTHVSVEAMCLSYYRKTLGFKGFHSEGGILRTLFGLLFYDVLFAYVPNVFQTPYQTCPLDLHTDAFYSARISEINARINEIGNGDAEHLITTVWTTHFERRTCVVGVRWDEYALADLCEVARCFGPTALGVVMRVMAQEYAARGGGVPDLFLWKVADDESESEQKGKGKVMFVEVKSENDRLSDTQRLWISVLLNAGVEVELCHAIASEVRVER